MLSTLQLFRSVHSLRRIPPVPLTRSITSRKFSSFQARKVESAKRQDISSWTKEQTTSWLSSVQPLTQATREKWEKLGVDGRSLIGITTELLMKECGMTFGTAFPIVSQIKNLHGREGLAQATRTNVPQILNAQTLLDCILNSSELKGHFKEDPAVPITLAQNRANFPRVGRQEALRDAFAAMAKRAHLRAGNPNAANDRLSNPLPATIATTGGGKSRYLGELAAKHPDDLELCEDTTMRGYLADSVSVTITYNGGFTYENVSEIDAQNPSLGLGLRVLFSYFVGPTNMDFDVFVAALEESLGPLFPRLTLKMAIACIVAHSGKGVLLLVDELMKCAEGKESAIHNAVNAIGSCLDQFDSSQFNAVITTLNGLAFSNETKSGREIIWILLSPASSADAELLFANVKRSFALNLCISDCNGHFRSLDSLAVLWGEVSSYDPPLSYAQLSRRLAASINRKYSISLPLVKAALLGERVESTAQCPGTNHTYGDYLAMGCFLNTPAGVTSDSADAGIETDTPDKFVPRVSPLQLLMFANAFKTKKGTKEYPYARTLAAMLDLKPNFVNGVAYQEFHAHWETLLRYLHSNDTEPWTIEELYMGALSEDSTRPRFYISAKIDLYYPWPTHFPQSLSKNSELPKFPEDALTRVIIPVVQNNPGFDIVSFEQKHSGIESEPVIICYECRFSEPTSTKRLTKAEVEKKRDLTVKQFQPYFDKKLGGLTLKEDNLFLIICAFRQVDHKALRELPRNTMVLNRDMLKNLYTPSLAARAQFIWPLEKEESTQTEAASEDANRKF